MNNAVNNLPAVALTFLPGIKQRNVWQGAASTANREDAILAA
jgi:hypothetical protein